MQEQGFVDWNAPFGVLVAVEKPAKVECDNSQVVLHAAIYNFSTLATKPREKLGWHRSLEPA